MKIQSTTRTLVATLVVAASASLAQAGTVTFTGVEFTDGGTGFGSETYLLGLQAQGSSTSESGSVFPDATLGAGYDPGLSKDDDSTGDATQGGSFTRSINDIFGGTSETGLGLVFNVNESGQNETVTLFDFTLYLFSGPGPAPTNVVDSWTFTAPATGLVVDNNEAGQGNAGWLFLVDPDDVSLSSWLTKTGGVFDYGEYRFGLSVTNITDVNNGAESFYITAVDPATVPLPPAAWLGLTLLAGVGVISRRRRARG